MKRVNGAQSRALTTTLSSIEALPRLGWALVSDTRR